MKRILRVLLIIGPCLFLFTKDVHAVEGSTYWLDNNVSSSFNDYRLFKWSGSNYNAVNIGIYGLKYDSTVQSNYWASVYNEQNLVTNSDGVTFSFSIDQRFKSGYLYSVSTFVCSNFSQINTLGYVTFGNTVVSSLTTEPTYSVVNKVDLSTDYSYIPSIDTSTLKSCEMYNSLIVPNLDGSWYSLRLRSNPQTSGRYYFVGYNISELGLYTDTIKNMMSTIVNTSGFATASSVNQVQTSVNQVKQEVQGMQEKQDQTNKKLDDLNNSMTSDDSDTTSKKCGMLCKLKGIFTGIIELPGKLVNLLVNALKSLFVPTDDQLYEIVNDSKELTENFGFVGEAVDFFLTIFTSLLGLVNANGCVELPEFTIGSTSLFESHTFWQSQQVCLNDNAILSSNINTIRTITSIALVSLFINFAAKKFFSILSKNDNDQARTDAYDIK